MSLAFQAPHHTFYYLHYLPIIISIKNVLNFIKLCFKITAAIANDLTEENLYQILTPASTIALNVRPTIKIPNDPVNTAINNLNYTRIN